MELLLRALERCAALRSLRLAFKVAPTDRRALAELLPRTCPRLRDFEWHGTRLRARATGRLLDGLADAGVRLEQVRFGGVLEPAVFAAAACHPLRLLSFNPTTTHAHAVAKDATAEVLATTALAMSEAFAAALAALQPTLVELDYEWYHPWPDAVAPAPLGARLERLYLNGTHCPRLRRAPALTTLDL